MLVCCLCSLLWPPSKSQPTLFVFSTCLPSWMSHYLTSHKYTYRCRNGEGEACSAHIKNSYWRCQQGAQRSWIKFRGNPKEKYGTLLCLQHRLAGVLFVTPPKKCSTPEPIVLKSIAKNIWQMHEHRWWILQYFGMLAEFPVSWLDRTGIQDLPKCQWVIVSGCKQWHKVTGSGLPMVSWFQQ